MFGLFRKRQQESKPSPNEYGKLSSEDFQECVYSHFSPQVSWTPQEIRSGVQKWTPAFRSVFIEALCEFLLEPSMSFGEKAKLFLGVSYSESDAIGYFHYIWIILGVEFPWPLPVVGTHFDVNLMDRMGQVLLAGTLSEEEEIQMISDSEVSGPEDSRGISQEFLDQLWADEMARRGWSQ